MELGKNHGIEKRRQRERGEKKKEEEPKPNQNERNRKEFVCVGRSNCIVKGKITPPFILWSEILMDACQSTLETRPTQGSNEKEKLISMSEKDWMGIEKRSRIIHPLLPVPNPNTTNTTGAKVKSNLQPTHVQSLNEAIESY